MLKYSVLSLKLFLILLLFLVLSSSSNAQNNDRDSLMIIQEKNDSAAYEQIQDTLRTLLNIIDTSKIQIDYLSNEQYGVDSTFFTKADSVIVAPVKDTVTLVDTIIIVDTVTLVDTIILRDTVTITETVPLSDSIIEFNSLLQMYNVIIDSLYFDEPDSVSQIISNLRIQLFKNSILYDDSTKHAIYKLIDYTRSREIEPIIEYLITSFEKKESLIEEGDSALIKVHDSIYNAVEFLINSIPEDSTKFYVTNLNKDSISFKSAAHENDSIRVNLIDNRGEDAVLWIKKSDRNVYKLYLEDGTYLEKARQQKVVNKGIGSKLELPGLRKSNKIKMILPIWTFDGLADIKFNQGVISESWAEGGENSISALSVLKYSADFTYGKLKSFDSDVEYRLGYLKAGMNTLQKNDDKFELNVKYGTTAFNNWYYSGLLNFKTQFLKGYEYTDSSRNAISEILSPAHLVFSLGLDYKPSSKLTVLISPLTSKFTIVADTVGYDQTRFGVGNDEIVRKEIGAYIKAISKIKIKSNLSLENKVNFFTNYADNPQNIDADWEVDLVVKLSDYIKMSINAHLIYDDDVSFIKKDGTEGGAKIQFKELFGIGFTYSF